MHALKAQKQGLTDLCSLHSSIDRFLEGKNGGKPVVLYGAGFALPAIVKKLEKYQFNIAAICDSSPSKHGTKYNDKYSIYSLDEVRRLYPEATFVISAPSYFWELQAELKNKVGADKVCPVDLECAHYFAAFEFHHFFRDHTARFEEVLDLLEDDESRQTFQNVIKAHLTGERRDFENAFTGAEDWYLFNSLLKPDETTVYLDCGAYDGDTVALFLKAATNGYKKIYGFEPDPSVHKKLYAMATANPAIEIIEKGVFNVDGVVSFSPNGVYSSVVGGNASAAHDAIQIPVAKIDSILSGARADIIKMDIEGAEYEAIIGARDTITKHKPRLAVCLYHKVEDFVRIPELLRTLVPEYKLRIRHQSESCTDTIVFASVE